MSNFATKPATANAAHEGAVKRAVAHLEAEAIRAAARTLEEAMKRGEMSPVAVVDFLRLFADDVETAPDEMP